MPARRPGLPLHALLLCIAAMLAAPGAGAQEAPPEFANAAEQERYESLLRELRCLVCQNQSLAESNAPLALDLRVEVLKRIRSGMSKEEILDFLVARYGDFVLYRPPLKHSTWVLWFGPFLLLAIAAIVIARIAMGRKAAEPEPLGEEERRRLRELGSPPDGSSP